MNKTNIICILIFSTVKILSNEYNPEFLAHHIIYTQRIQTLNSWLGNDCLSIQLKNNARQELATHYSGQYYIIDISKALIYTKLIIDSHHQDPHNVFYRDILIADDIRARMVGMLQTMDLDTRYNCLNEYRAFIYSQQA